MNKQLTLLLWLTFLFLFSGCQTIGGKIYAENDIYLGKNGNGATIYLDEIKHLGGTTSNKEKIQLEMHIKAYNHLMI